MYIYISNSPYIILLNFINVIIISNKKKKNYNKKFKQKKNTYITKLPFITRLYTTLVHTLPRK